jgi:hypothetical protein
LGQRQQRVTPIRKPPIDEAGARVRRVRRYLAENGFLLRKAGNTYRRPRDLVGYEVLRADTHEVVAGLGFTLSVEDVEQFLDDVETPREAAGRVA